MLADLDFDSPQYFPFFVMDLTLSNGSEFFTPLTIASGLLGLESPCSVSIFFIRRISCLSLARVRMLPSTGLLPLICVSPVRSDRGRSLWFFLFP